MSTHDDGTSEQPVPAEADPGAETAPAPVDQAELDRRTGRGIARWLMYAVLLFWASVMGAGYGRWTENETVLRIALFALFTALIVSLLLYLSVMLEPGAFAHRGVRIWLAASFGDLVVLSLIRLLTGLLRGNAFQFTPHAILPILGILAAIGVLALAYRVGQRFLFLAALLVLLASSLLPV